MDRSKAIIAVFGSTDQPAVELARALGAAIANRGQIVLSGGTDKGAGTVRGSAIEGTGSSPWVGVNQKGPIGGYPEHHGFVIDTNLGHKRNYLEAHLCDAAIGLAGGDGTKSEVLFALSLGRPVALVGDGWQDDGWDLDADPQTAIDDLILAASRRVGWGAPGIVGLDDRLHEISVRAGLRDMGRHRFFPSDVAGRLVDSVLTWILDSIESGPGRAGSFPEIEGYEKVKATYDEWHASQ